MKLKRMMALATAMAMLVLMMASPLAVAEGLAIDNGLYGIELTDGEGFALEDVDLSDLFVGNLVMDLETGEVFDIPRDEAVAGDQTPEVYMVTFDACGGSPVPEAQQVAAGEAVARPADPAREGYAFAGWTLNGADFFAGDNAVYGDICLVAAWESQEATGETIIEVEDPEEELAQAGETAGGQAEVAEDGIEVDLSQEGEAGDGSQQETDLEDGLLIEDSGVNLEAPVEEEGGEYSENVSASGAADNDELLEGYFWRALEGGMRSNGETASGRKLLVDSGLTATVQLYDAMKGRIRQVAAGQLTSTVFSFSMAELGLKGHWWTKEDLGLSSLEASDDRTAALKRVEGIDISKLSQALLLDLPYDLYWFDKNEGTRFSFTTETERQGGVITRISITSLTLSMYVSQDYSKSRGIETFEVGSMPGKVKNAVNNINDILSQNSGKGDYEKLKAYKDAVCKYATFDHASVGEGESGDVKQLIYVFDGDQSTKVVCTGYAKAFKYLCDRSTFQGDVECEMMSGVRKAKTENGSHMWNVIKMSDGRYYLADITHCDTAGDDSTFMKGCTGDPGGPYGIKTLTYFLGTDSERFFAEGSAWLNYSHEDYGVNYDVSILARKGRVTVSPEGKKANPGTTITLGLQPAAGCGYADPVVKAGSVAIVATKVDDATWTFVMPAAQVTVEVDFPSSIAGLYAIVTPESVIGGTLAVSVNGNDALTAMTGDAIQLTCTANNGYTVVTPQVNCSTGPVALTEAGSGIWTFVMPGDDVVVDPFFRAKDDWRNFQKQIDDAGNGSVIQLTQDLIATDKDFGLEFPENKSLTLDLNGHVIDRNLKEAGVYGFAIKVMGNLTIMDSSAGQTGVIRNAFNNQSGGAICVMPEAHLTFSGGKITDCTCTVDGGGIYVFKGSLTMNGGVIENCTGNNGGGILCDKGSMVISGGTISDNKATTSGGGVYSYLGSLEISGGTIRDNTAKDYGGGIYWRSEDGALTISGKPTISGNQSVDGGGVWAAGPRVTVSGGTFSKNTCKGGSVGGGGGGLFAQADELNISGGTFSDNSAKWGAGVYTVSRTTTVSKGTFTNNKCASSGNGGGLYVDDTLDGNKVSTTLKVTGGTFSGNTANFGAGIYSKGKTTTISGGTLKSNTAKFEGGGVYVKGDSFKLSGGTFSGNKAQRGGGVYTNTKSASVSKGTVKGNTASNGGGGLYANDTKFQLSGSVLISGNSAPTGGGLYTKADTTTIQGGTIKTNKSTNCGGGVYANGKSLTLKKGTITGNTAKNYGAGLYLTGTSAKMTGGTVKGNTSQSSGAGAYINKGTFTVTGGSISGNTSKKYSGGVGLGKGSLTVSGSAVIYGNKGVTNGKSVSDDINVGSKAVIKVSGKLNSKAKIGVRGGPHVFTKGLGKNGNVKAFVNNDTDRYSIKLNTSKGEAEIVK